MSETGSLAEMDPWRAVELSTGEFGLECHDARSGWQLCGYRYETAGEALLAAAKSNRESSERRITTTVRVLEAGS